MKAVSSSIGFDRGYGLQAESYNLTLPEEGRKSISPSLMILCGRQATGISAMETDTTTLRNPSPFLLILPFFFLFFFYTNSLYFPRFT